MLDNTMNVFRFLNSVENYYTQIKASHNMMDENPKPKRAKHTALLILPCEKNIDEFNAKRIFLNLLCLMH